MKAQTPFARCLERIGERDLVAFFDNRVARTTIANWKAGRHLPPQWAIDRTRQRWLELESAAREDLAQLKPSVGLSAGAKNLAAYLARRT